MSGLRSILGWCLVMGVTGCAGAPMAARDDHPAPAETARAQPAAPAAASATAAAPAPGGSSSALLEGPAAETEAPVAAGSSVEVAGAPVPVPKQVYVAVPLTVKQARRVRVDGKELVFLGLSALGGAEVASFSFDGNEIALSLRPNAGDRGLFPSVWLDDYGITLLAVNRSASTAKVAVAHATERPSGEAVRTSWAVGAKVRLPDGAEARLVSHLRQGKGVRVRLTYWVGGALHAEQWTGVLRRGDSWKHRGLRFTVVDFEVDRSMEVIVQRLALEAVTP